MIMFLYKIKAIKKENIRYQSGNKGMLNTKTDIELVMC